MISTIAQLDPRCKQIPDCWVKPLHDWETYLRAGGASDATLTTRLAHARRIARAMKVPPAAVQPEEMLAWLAARNWALETRRSCNAALRSLWGYLMATGAVDRDVSAAVPRVTTSRGKPRPLGDVAYGEALASADDRTSLILQLSAEMGMRRGEIALVHNDDLVEDLAGTSLVVHGKGRKTRVLPMTDRLARRVRKACHEGGGWAFPGQIDGHLSPGYVGVLAHQVLVANKLHQGRHRFATKALRSGANLMVVKELLGHESLATTQIYLAVAGDELRAAVEAVAAT